MSSLHGWYLKSQLYVIHYVKTLMSVCRSATSVSYILKTIQEHNFSLTHIHSTWRLTTHGLLSSSKVGRDEGVHSSRVCVRLRHPPTLAIVSHHIDRDPFLLWYSGQHMRDLASRVAIRDGKEIGKINCADWLTCGNVFSGSNGDVVQA